MPEDLRTGSPSCKPERERRAMCAEPFEFGEHVMKLPLLGLLSLIAFFCLSCAKLPEQPKPRQVVSARGNVTYVIQCFKKDGCAEQAKRLCPGGYTTINSASVPYTYDDDGSVRTITKYVIEIGCN